MDRRLKLILTLAVIEFAAIYLAGSLWLLVSGDEVSVAALLLLWSEPAAHVTLVVFGLSILLGQALLLLPVRKPIPKWARPGCLR